MKKRNFLLITLLFLASTLFAQQLTYKIANPRIVQLATVDYFQFEIQVKADLGTTYLWVGQINLNFDNTALSGIVAQWGVTLAPAFSANNSLLTPAPKYSLNKTITPANVLNIGILGNVDAYANGPGAADWVLITTAYQPLVTVFGRITNTAGIAALDFNKVKMDGFQKYVTGPLLSTLYANPNGYDAANFLNTYVGRIFSNYTTPWTQVGGPVNWATAVNTSIWDGTATIPTTGVSNASAIRIHSGATLTIPPTGQLTAASIENNTTGGLTIQSDATGTGSLITATASGTATTQSYLTTARWHNVSSPLSGQLIADFLTNNPNVGTSGAARGMMDYNPATNLWNPLFTTTPVTPGSLGGGKGYSLRVKNTPPGLPVTFTGALQTGAQPVTVAPTFWNCVGNPYTSAIGLNDGFDVNNSFLAVNGANLNTSYAAIYVWADPDASNGQAGKYKIITRTTGDASFQQGQAFLVNMAVGSTINFNALMQLHSTATALKSASAPWPAINLIAEVNGLKNSALITFNSQMTKGLDPTYDAGLLKGESELVVYTKLVEDNGIPFAIQALPGNAEMVIPVGVDSKAGGNVTFSSENTNLSPDMKVILEDKVSKTFTDLSKSAYTTTIAANSTVSDRFFLHTSDLISGLDDQTPGNTSWDKLNVYAVRNVELRIVGEVSDRAVVSLCDVLGRVILVNNLNAGILNTINLPSIKNGVYLITVKDNGKVRTFKILVTA